MNMEVLYQTQESLQEILTENKVKRVVVFGGAGFIGRHLCQALLEKDYEVYVIDCLVSEYSEEKNNDFIQHSGLGGFRVADIRDKKSVQNALNSILSGEKIDVFVNLACPASSKQYLKEDLFTFETCVEGTRNILEIAEELQVGYILHVSSSEIYGSGLALREDQVELRGVDTLKPRAAYVEGKRAAETVCSIYRRRGLKVGIVRLFNVYGEGCSLQDTRVIPTFLREMMQRKKSKVTVSTYRSFTHVEDVVTNMVKMIGVEISDTFNVGTVDNLKAMPELYEDLYVEMFGYGPDMNVNWIYSADTKVDGEPELRSPAISRLSAVRGFYPVSKITYEEGIKRIVKFFKENYKVS